MRLGPVPHRAGCSPHTVQHPGVAPPPATRPDLLPELLETEDEGVGEGRELEKGRAPSLACKKHNLAWNQSWLLLTLKMRMRIEGTWYVSKSWFVNKSRGRNCHG
jgi:hypothetical protein